MFIDADQYSLHPVSRKLLCNRNHYRHHNQSKCRVMSPAQTDTSIEQFLSSRLIHHCKRGGGKKIVRARRTGELLRMSEATPIKSHQHGCPNTSWTRTIIDIHHMGTEPSRGCCEPLCGCRGQTQVFWKSNQYSNHWTISPAPWVSGFKSHEYWCHCRKSYS